MFDPRTQHSRQILDDVGRRYSLEVMQPPIRKSIRFAEAPRAGKSILRYASTHPGALAYREIARSLIA